MLNWLHDWLCSLGFHDWWWETILLLKPEKESDQKKLEDRCLAHFTETSDVGYMYTRMCLHCSKEQCAMLHEPAIGFSLFSWHDIEQVDLVRRWRLDTPNEKG